VARATEAAADDAGVHLDAAMGAAMGAYHGSSGKADALAAATAAMEEDFSATSRSPPKAVHETEIDRAAS
jgi:hypothetical protein